MSNKKNLNKMLKCILRAWSIGIPYFMLFFSSELPKSPSYLFLYGLIVGACIETGYYAFKK
jgi:hypothetical protein